MYLPEDDPEVITSFVNYVYRGRIAGCLSLNIQLDGNAKANLCWEKLYPLFSFAEKVCHNDLANKVMDTIQDVHSKDKGRWPGPECAQQIYRRTHQNSRLRHYVMLCWVRRSISSTVHWKTKEEEGISLFKDMPDITMDFAVAYTKYNSLFHDDKLLDPCRRDEKKTLGSCFFRTYRDKEVCYLAAK